MVLLTMTPSIVEGLNSLPATSPAEHPDDANHAQIQATLADPEVGKPISHAQIVDLWRTLKASGASPIISLEQLLRGSQVYIPPPPPKPEPVGHVQ